MIQFLALFTSFATVSCVLFHLITPDDVRHANQYCYKTSDLNYQLNGNKSADNKDTHCFVKCFLKRTGLINLTTLGVDEKKFNHQNQKSSGNYVRFQKTLDGSCKPYYNEWIQAIQGEGRLWISSSFYFDKKDEEDFNMKYPFITKPIGSSAFDICLKRKFLENIDFILCLFSYLRFFDAYGRIDRHEIMKTFNKCSKNGSKLQKCIHHGNSYFNRGPETMASKLRSCLQGICPSFKKILETTIKHSTNF
ncbi:Obp83g family protein [Megaselia abdita]